MRQSARHTYGFHVTVYVHWFIIWTPWPKQVVVRLLVTPYLLLRLHRPLYSDTCADVWWCVACGVAILGSRCDTLVAGPSIAMHRFIVTTLLMTQIRQMESSKSRGRKIERSLSWKEGAIVAVAPLVHLWLLTFSGEGQMYDGPHQSCGAVAQVPRTSRQHFQQLLYRVSRCVFVALVAPRLSIDFSLPTFS